MISNIDKIKFLKNLIIQKPLLVNVVQISILFFLFLCAFLTWTLASFLTELVRNLSLYLLGKDVKVQFVSEEKSDKKSLIELTGHTFYPRRGV